MTDTASPQNAGHDPNDVDLTIRLTEAPGGPECGSLGRLGRLP